MAHRKGHKKHGGKKRGRKHSLRLIGSKAMHHKKGHKK